MFRRTLLGGAVFLFSFVAARGFLVARDAPPIGAFDRSVGQREPSHLGTTKGSRRANTSRQGAVRGWSASSEAQSGIDISELSDIDRAILTKGDLKRSQNVFIARHAARRAVQMLVLRENKSCHERGAPAPSRLKLNFNLRMGQGRAEIYRLNFIEISAGAPMPAASVGCIESRIKGALPVRIEDRHAKALEFEGGGTFLVEVNNTAECSL